MKMLRRVVAMLSTLLGVHVFAAPNVLYVTHEPGRWHEYTPQLAAFRSLASTAGWTLEVATGSVEEAQVFLSRADYGIGYDAIVYNFCLADSRDLDAMNNLIVQTVEHGVPSLLLHCSMHSWWDTFRKGKSIPGNRLGKARADKRLLKAWQKTNPDVSLPAWGDFTGVASTGHGPKKPVALTAVVEHPATAALPSGYTTVATELYNNHYLTDDVVPLIRGVQGSSGAVVMWLAPRGAGQIMGLSLGHGVEEWNDPVFRALVSDGVNFLMGR